MYLEMSKEELAQEFEKNLLETNRGYNYYVNWENISGLDDLSLEIHALDDLIKCSDKDFYTKFKNAITKLPSIIKVFPYLFALDKKSREDVTKNDTLIIISGELGGKDFDEYSFNSDLIKNNLDEELIKKYYSFFKQMGLKNLFQNKIEKSVWDYIIGVLVGLDSNGRKNRGGTVFELACEPIIKNICKQYGLDLLIQKQFKTLDNQYRIFTNENIGNRKADFILVDKNSNKSLNIEVNFYNGTGSKPEEIINAYSDRQNKLNECGIEFCLLTDGDCWRNASNQLTVGFNNIKYLTNFKLSKNGMLEEIVKEVFGK